MLEPVLKVLANRRRLAILEFLKKRKEATVGTIANSIKLSFTSTSKHLRLLDRAGILDKEQVGLEVSYSIVPSMHRIIVAVLNEL